MEEVNLLTLGCVRHCAQPPPSLFLRYDGGSRNVHILMCSLFGSASPVVVGQRVAWDPAGRGKRWATEGVCVCVCLCYCQHRYTVFF